jgi:hypothetical protein
MEPAQYFVAMHETSIKIEFLDRFIFLCSPTQLPRAFHP